MSIESEFEISRVADFSARGLRRCVVPGVSCSIDGGVSGPSQSEADFWCGPEGVVLMRISWLGYRWSYRVLPGHCHSTADEHDFVERLAFAVGQELHRWMTEDEADTPPFDT